MLYSLIFLFVQFNFVGKLLGPKGNSMKRLQVVIKEKQKRNEIRENEILHKSSVSLIYLYNVDKRQFKRYVYKVRSKSSIKKS